MLDNNSNIDEMLREGMANFEPTPPADAWDFIQGQVQPVAPSNPGLGEKLVSSIKQMGIVSKVALVLAVPVLAGISYFVLNQTPVNKTIDKQDLVQTEPAEIKEIEISQGNVEGKKLAEEILKEPAKEKTLIASKKENVNLGDEPVPEIEVPINIEKKDEVENLPKPIEKTILGGDTKKAETKKESIEDDIPITKPPVLEAEKEPEPQRWHEEPVLTNVFSPNGDGRNDLFEIQMASTNFYHMRIYDKKGQLVFETEQFNVFWNGMNFRSGMECEAGVYTYIFDYQFEKTGKIETKTGFINLLR
ncbi:MAG: gliding motility-associated C-terminal domain-containing protein [Bacteroidia bacterium]|nr:gliding motility-associated C-terminal domain-containing protein [Bacteroidia bacterium]MCF8426988.1 gliding motility-associated C-terminal domain-containing protein [Bacteroidia bacterium]MCF8445607.1 gliding motility-associated C-terminal domain-containing protein [Bacteroidia bacterium]